MSWRRFLDEASTGCITLGFYLVGIQVLGLPCDWRVGVVFLVLGAGAVVGWRVLERRHEARTQGR